MRIEIRALQRQLGVTSLYVTHDQVEAMTLADRMVVMNAGIAEQVGAPLEVYEKPASTFVAGFIGSPPMNFLPAGAFSGAGPVAAFAARAGERDRATIGVRPEHLTLARADDALITAEVRLAETLGAETLIHLALADGTGFVMRQDGAAEVPAPGTRIGLTCEPRHLHLYDAAGKRVELSPA